MPRKRKRISPMQYIKLPKAKLLTMAKKPFGQYAISLPPILPQILIIAVCVGIYYAMIHFYLFFEWGFYIYYTLKLVVAFELLSSSRHSLVLPLAALALGCMVLFSHCLFFNTLMNTDTAWQLSAVGLIGLLIYFFKRRTTAYVQ